MSKADISNFTGSANLTHDPDSRTTPKGTTVTDLRIAQNVGYGQYQSTVFTVLTVWGKNAEFLAQYAKKGDKVFFSGAQYKVKEWEDREGNKRKTHYFELQQSGQIELYSKDRGGSQAESVVEEEPVVETQTEGW